MSSGSRGLDLTPADLDRLEDALEDLELSSALDELDADDLVAHRLSEYREIMRLGREAMPLEEVPAGLLDGVIAQARQAAAAAPAAAAPAPSFWARWRLGVWVPALAFAGSAALLLVVLVPKGADEPGPNVATAPRSEAPAAAQAEAKAAPADGRLAYAEPAREHDGALFEGSDELRSGGVAIGERAPEPAAAPAPEEEQAVADDAEGDPSLRRKSATGTAAGGKPAPPKAPAASSKGKTEPWPDPAVGGGAKRDDADDEAKEKKPDAGSELWSELARADEDRRGGGCGLAKMRYDKLRKADDPRVRARALAGAGLCAAASDDMATAKKLFAQARAADSDVSSFIDRELASLEDVRAKAAQADQAAE